MVDFLFLIPLSPGNDGNSLRARLQEVCFDSLQDLRSSYVVWYFADRDVDRPNFRRISVQGETKEERMKGAGDLLIKSTPLARYIVRLDDDDPIRPAAFDALAGREFDVAYDGFHRFYDLVSGLGSAQERPWIANTAIHAYSHALARVPAVGGAPTGDGKNYLFACDHSRAWHPYYADKHRVELPPADPLYVRVLNPSSISAGGGGLGFDQKTYFRYLDGFGTWQAKWPADMQTVEEQLARIRRELYPDPPTYKPKRKKRFGLF